MKCILSVPRLFLPAVAALVLLWACDANGPLELEIPPEASAPEISEPFERIGHSKVLGSNMIAFSQEGGLVTESLLEAQAPASVLAETLAGVGVTVSNVEFTGHPSAAGTFSGGDGIIGFEDGIILSTGYIASVVGPNEFQAISTNLGQPGDAALSELAGVETFDATILEFDFVPDADRVYFEYVFGSEEYNEWVGSEFNDVFAFWVNGANCAVVGDPAVPVTINTINNGYDGSFSNNPIPASPSNPHLYINNDPFWPDHTGNTVPEEDLLNTEMDGLTVVLTCEAEVNAGVTNTMRLGIADASDAVLDSNVFIRAESLTTEPPAPDPDPNTPPVLDAIGDQTVDEGSELSFTATATDADGDDLTFSLLDAPAGATIDATTGEFSWTPPDGPATATFTVVVSDGDDTDQETITVTVLNVAPDVTDVSGPAAAVELGGSAGIQVSFTDPGILDTHTATVDWGDGTTSDEGTVTSPFSASHTYGAVGSYTVVVTVTDKDGDSGTGTTTIEVTQTPEPEPDPDPPLADGTDWCSAGFWSNNGLRQGEWPAGYEPDDAVNTLFESAEGYLGATPLLGALEGYRLSRVRRNTIEGASEILLRQAVAAALNAEVFGEGFPAGSVQDIVDEVNGALSSGDRETILGLASWLDAMNNNYQLDENGDVVLDEEGNPVVIGTCGLPRS